MIVAPPVAGLDYTFLVEYGSSLSPAGVSDGSSVTGPTAVAFVVDVEDGVADSVPPTFTSAPADLDLATADPAGAVVEYELPSATDAVDPAPMVGCEPAPGSLFPIGLTTVTCTATDASGNQVAETFTVTVHLAVVAWDEPVLATGTSATSGRSLPIKVRAWLDGSAVGGDATLVVTTCDPGVFHDATSIDAVWQLDAERWMAVLDTTGLAAGCQRVQLVVDGRVLGSFDLTIITPPKVAGTISRGTNHPT